MKDTIMVSLCLYNVHDVSMCVRISLLLQLVSSHLRKIFLLSMWVLPGLLCMMGMSGLTRDIHTHTCERASFKFLVLSPRDIQVDMTLSQLYRFTGSNKSPAVCSMWCGVFIAIVCMICANTFYKHQHPTSTCVSIALPAKTITVYTG